MWIDVSKYAYLWYNIQAQIVYTFYTGIFGNIKYLL